MKTRGLLTGGNGLNWEQNDTICESKVIHHGANLAPVDVIDTTSDINISLLKIEQHYRELQIDLTAFKRFPWWSHLFVLLILPFLMA